ncbi:reverse transcriptase domain-containing protein [Tanacetum coccineum]|uniref:Reverse transcriptase domain-containing protein n=1 Tax=Tanacetum coccineum TaxID=301880 RepID=A0ABQ5EVY1_9ASTR
MCPHQSEVQLQDPWILFTDGSSCVDGSGAGLILTNPEGMEFTYALRFEFTTTNNEAEYEALIAGLRIAARMGVRNLEANVDSRLVANHVLGANMWQTKDNMVQYLDKTKSLSRWQEAYGLGTTGPTHAPRARDMIKKCKIAKYIDNPVTTKQELTPITLPWHSTSGVSTSAGPFPVASGRIEISLSWHRILY